jgi:hypothetical protein
MKRLITQLPSRLPYEGRGQTTIVRILWYPPRHPCTFLFVRFRGPSLQVTLVAAKNFIRQFLAKDCSSKVRGHEAMLGDELEPSRT